MEKGELSVLQKFSSWSASLCFLSRVERWVPLGLPEDLCWTLQNDLSKCLDFTINYRENYLIWSIKSDWMCAPSASCFHLLWIVLSFWIWDTQPSLSWYHTALAIPKHDVVPEQQLWCLEWKGLKIHSWNYGYDNAILLFAVMTCIDFNGISNQEH